MCTTAFGHFTNTVLLRVWNETSIFQHSIFWVFWLHYHIVRTKYSVHTYVIWDTLLSRTPHSRMYGSYVSLKFRTLTLGRLFFSHQWFWGRSNQIDNKPPTQKNCHHRTGGREGWLRHHLRCTFERTICQLAIPLSKNFYQQVSSSVLVCNKETQDCRYAELYMEAFYYFHAIFFF